MMRDIVRHCSHDCGLNVSQQFVGGCFHDIETRSVSDGCMFLDAVVRTSNTTELERLGRHHRSKRIARPLFQQDTERQRREWHALRWSLQRRRSRNPDTGRKADFSHLGSKWQRPGVRNSCQWYRLLHIPAAPQEPKRDRGAARNARLGLPGDGRGRDSQVLADSNHGLETAPVFTRSTPRAND
jgi:hypothetical protein